MGKTGGLQLPEDRLHLERRAAEATRVTEPVSKDPRWDRMLKLAGDFLVVMIIAGILGFVVDVAGGLTKIAFFVCLIGLAGTLVMKFLRKT